MPVFRAAAIRGPVSLRTPLVEAIQRASRFSPRDDPGRPFFVLGVVSAQVDGEDPEGLRDELQEAAAELGADALVAVEIHWERALERLRASGVAVRYQ